MSSGVVIALPCQFVFGTNLTSFPLLGLLEGQERKGVKNIFRNQDIRKTHRARTAMRLGLFVLATVRRGGEGLITRQENKPQVRYETERPEVHTNFHVGTGKFYYSSFGGLLGPLHTKILSHWYGPLVKTFVIKWRSSPRPIFPFTSAPFRLTVVILHVSMILGTLPGPVFKVLANMPESAEDFALVFWVTTYPAKEWT